MTYTREFPLGYQLISQQKFHKSEGNGMTYLKWWKARAYNQEYSTQQDSSSDLMEKSKAFQTNKSSENLAPPNQLYNKC